METINILILNFWLVAGALSLRACPKLQPVAIDAGFIFNRQPEGGFYAAYSSGEDSMPRYSSKSMNSNIKGEKKVCVQTKIEVSGKELLTTPPIECSCKNSFSAVYCEFRSEVMAETALKATGMKFPKALVSVVVDTDNSTFMAWGSCLDGAMYQWSILTTDPKQKMVRSKTAAALFLTKEELKNSNYKRVKTGRTQVTKGPCGSSSSIMKGMQSLNHGLSGLFG